MQHYICMGNSLYANRHVSVLKLWKHFYGIEFRFHHELCWAAIVVRDLQFPFGGTNCLQFCETYTKFTFEKDDDDEEEGNNRGMILNFTSCKFSFKIRLQYHQTVHIPHDCIIISFLYSPVMTSRNDPSMKSQQMKERDEALKDYTWLSSRSARELKQI